jgi:hypothetical protein
MPYAISFTKRVEIADPSIYINDCCVGGDVVLDRVLPDLKTRYSDIQADQEDWGWFAWFKHGSINLAVNIFADDSQNGAFKIHLTASRRRLIFGYKIEDGVELSLLRQLVVTTLNSWTVEALVVEHVDEKYMPTGTTV